MSGECGCCGEHAADCTCTQEEKLMYEEKLMKITPRKGYIVVSSHEIIEEKKSGLLVLPSEGKKKTYLKVESDGELYKKGDCVLAQSFRSKVQVEENLFLVNEEDIIASFIMDDSNG